MLKISKQEYIADSNIIRRIIPNFPCNNLKIMLKTTMKFEIYGMRKTIKVIFFEILTFQFKNEINSSKNIFNGQIKIIGII